MTFVAGAHSFVRRARELDLPANLSAMKVLAAALTVVLTLLLSACGTAASGSSDGGETAATDRNTTQKGRESSESSMLTETNFLERVGEAHRAQSSVISTFTIEESGRTLQMQGPVQWGDQPEDTAVDITSSNSDNSTDIRMILVGNALYLQGRAGVPTDKFLKFDMNDPLNQMFKQGEFFADQFSPVGFLDQLDKSSPEITAAGDGEVVDGVKTTRWKIRVDAKDVPSLGNAIRLKQDLDMTLWIGDDLLLRKLQAEVENGTLVQSWSDWGTQTNIVAPSNSRIVDLSELAGPLGGS